MTTTTTTEEIRIGQTVIRFLVEAEETAGTAALFEFDVPTGGPAPPAHSHDSWEETIYGLSGTLAAKGEGFRHLARYTTHTYPEPVRLRGQYLNHNCQNCHQGTARFEAVTSHHTVADQLGNNAMTCLNCHGLAHPSPAQRTPGSPDYLILTADSFEPALSPATT